MSINRQSCVQYAMCHLIRLISASEDDNWVRGTNKNETRLLPIPHGALTYAIISGSTMMDVCMVTLGSFRFCWVCRDVYLANKSRGSMQMRMF